MTRSGRPLALSLLALLLACNGPEPAVEDPSTVAWMIGKRRQRMKVVAEGAVSSLLQMASVESDQAHLEFEEELAEVEMGVELGIVDPLLEPYGLNDRERFRAQIEKIEHKYAERLAKLVDAYEKRLWVVVIEAGKLEQATDPETRSGYRDLDDMATSALGQIKHRANVEGIHQQALLRAYDSTELVRLFKEDIEGLGRLMLCRSLPSGAASRMNEDVLTAIVFQRKGLAPDVPIRFVQAVHHRAERGGIVLIEVPWALDQTELGSGVLPLSEDISDPSYVATRIHTLKVRDDFEEFKTLRDCTLVSLYHTGMVNAETGELLATMAWEVRRGLTFDGRVYPEQTQREARLVDSTPLVKWLQAADLDVHAGR